MCRQLRMPNVLTVSKCMHCRVPASEGALTSSLAGAVPGNRQMILRVAVYALSQAAALGGQIGAAGSFDASMLFSQIPTALVLLLMLAVVVTQDPRRRLWLYQCLSGTSSQSQ